MRKLKSETYDKLVFYRRIVMCRGPGMFALEEGREGGGCYCKLGIIFLYI